MLANLVRYALVMIAISLVPVSAGATWSLSGVDRETDEVGIAGATCWSEIERIGGLVPGVGVVAAQAWAWWEPWLRDRMVERLVEGASPQQAINTVVAEDPNSSLRQYGVVDLQGRTATFTGTDVEQWRGSVKGTDVTVQGNILPGSAVITRPTRPIKRPAGLLRINSSRAWKQAPSREAMPAARLGRPRSPRSSALPGRAMTPRTTHQSRRGRASARRC